MKELTKTYNKLGYGRWPNHFDNKLVLCSWSVDRQAWIAKNIDISEDPSFFFETPRKKIIEKGAK